MKEATKQEWILRVGIFGTFLGHGVFALQGKHGFSEATAASLLPMIGVLDITVAVLALLWPIRIVLIWAAFWGFSTALIRPISGEPIWDFVERTANWAAPLALLVIEGLPKKIKDLFEH
ncbi:hypothetical protein HYU15_03825 [Candidatus Woesearchaeota archaeon]|nr:hypothetical protein [Candidatus Woesearchaeota archaeon]